MHGSVFILNYLDKLCEKSGHETISGRLQKLDRIVSRHQCRRAARYQRKAFSRSFRGSCREKKLAFWMWDHAINSPPPQLKTILKGGI